MAAGIIDSGHPARADVDEAAALRATIAAHPEADLPRLVYADWLEDGGDDTQAAFLRTQVQLAHEPAWSPLAVRCRHHTPEVLTGEPWRHTLPAVSPRIAAWHPETPFRRGAPDWLVVRDLASFLDDAGRLFDLAPITTLSLPTSSLDYWQEFARRPWLRQVRALHFYGVSTPIEPLRVLANAVNASGVEELTLERTSGPAFPVVLSDLFQSDLGKRLKRLDLRAGGDNGGEWIAELAALTDRHHLEALSLRTMAVGERGIRRLAELPIVGKLLSFDMRNEELTANTMRRLLRSSHPRQFEEFRLNRIVSNFLGWESALLSPALERVRKLDVDTIRLDQLVGWSRSRHLEAIVSLKLRHCWLLQEAVEQIVSMRAWPNLTELDLRNGPRVSVRFDALLGLEPPGELAALILSGKQLKPEFRSKLQDHFRGAVVFADE